MLKVVVESRSLNQIWKNAYFHTIKSILTMFKQRRKVGLLGIVISKKDCNIKNCVAFYGRLRKQRYSMFAVEGKKNTCKPDLHAEFYIEIRRFDNDMMRKARYLITE